MIVCISIFGTFFSLSVFRIHECYTKCKVRIYLGLTLYRSSVPCACMHQITIVPLLLYIRMVRPQSLYSQLALTLIPAARLNPYIKRG